MLPTTIIVVIAGLGLGSIIGRGVVRTIPPLLWSKLRCLQVVAGSTLTVGTTATTGSTATVGTTTTAGTTATTGKVATAGDIADLEAKMMDIVGWLMLSAMSYFIVLAIGIWIGNSLVPWFQQMQDLIVNRLLPVPMPMASASKLA